MFIVYCQMALSQVCVRSALMFMARSRVLYFFGTSSFKNRSIQHRLACVCAGESQGMLLFLKCQLCVLAKAYYTSFGVQNMFQADHT